MNDTRHSTSEPATPDTCATPPASQYLKAEPLSTVPAITTSVSTPSPASIPSTRMSGMIRARVVPVTAQNPDRDNTK